MVATTKKVRGITLMKNNLNKHNAKDLLKGKGLIYTGIFILLTIITLVIIIVFLSLVYISFRNS